MSEQRQLPEGAIGFKDQLTPEQLVGKHIDGLTGAVFETEEAYLNHVSPVTGKTPKDPEHLGENFKRVSDAAVARGDVRKEAPAPAQAAEIAANHPAQNPQQPPTN